jgi:M6 family metalloprotease-like protein
MKKCIFILIIGFFFFCKLSQAAWLENVPQTITQPDGTVIKCLATGDEFYNWLHDSEGYTIIRNHNTGYHTYAQLDNEQLIPSKCIVGKSDPARFGLVPGINISAEAMKKIRFEFLKNHMPEKSPVPGYDKPGSNKNTGILNNLVVYVRFSDQSEFTKDTLEIWDMFNSTLTGSSSMYNYFKSVSYNQLEIPSTFYPHAPGPTVVSYQDINPRSYYVPYDPLTNPNGYLPDQKAEREHNLLKRAIEYIDEEVPVSLELDFNNDGYVDNMAFVVRGEASAWSTLLWPHRWALYTEYVYIHGKRVYDYNFQIEERLGITGVGVLCHEMFHSLSAKDLYHWETHPVTPIGPWDVMGSVTDPPQSMGAYMKFRYGGWIEEIPEISECGTYTLNPLTSQEKNCYSIASPNSTTDYFVLEYRLKEGVFEGGLPRSGLLIYKVNTLESGNGNALGPPDELYAYRPGGTLSVNGYIYDAVFAEDYGRTEFNDNTNPGCFLSNGTPGGIDIFNISMCGETISFEVNFEKEPVADLSASHTLITENCIVDFIDLSVCDVDSWEWTFEGGSPETSNEQFPSDILYENEGSYDVSLTVSNQWGQNTLSYPDFITVSTLALPVVNFSASDTLICTGAVVEFTDLSEICPIDWDWEITPNVGVDFINGTSPASQNPEVVFNEPGYFNVKLSVVNVNGEADFVRNDYIKSGGIQISGEWEESFEIDNIEASAWSVVNPDEDITWELFDVGGLPNGTKAAGINLFNYFSFNQRDQLISPALNISGMGTPCFLNFKHAYTTTNPSYSDSLIVKISQDCGETWTRVLAIAEDGSNNFITRENIPFNFYPIEETDWCGVGFGAACSSIELLDFDNHPNTKIMFESASVIGNNLFIDDVRLDIMESVKGKVDEEQISIFPNPSAGFFSISSGLNLNGVDAIIYNQKGQILKQLIIDQASAGNTFNFDLSNFHKGIYILKLTGENFSSTKKLIIN